MVATCQELPDGPLRCAVRGVFTAGGAGQACDAAHPFPRFPACAWHRLRLAFFLLPLCFSCLAFAVLLLTAVSRLALRSSSPLGFSCAVFLFLCRRSFFLLQAFAASPLALSSSSPSCAVFFFRLVPEAMSASCVLAAQRRWGWRCSAGGATGAVGGGGMEYAWRCACCGMGTRARLLAGWSALVFSTARPRSARDGIDAGRAPPGRSGCPGVAGCRPVRRLHGRSREVGSAAEYLNPGRSSRPRNAPGLGAAQPARLWRAFQRRAGVLRNERGLRRFFSATGAVIKAEVLAF